ncbi:FAD linked oxidase [Neofusicoccum parvum]|uniref:FAD linked oxidase n=1 Tax=Neofusicoccum parvum TaxID=310453 RepID=A0ACB5RYY7_9PEZI|nr:FAD linked oxidase [Neofusicoccum parvum]
MAAFTTPTGLLLALLGVLTALLGHEVSAQFFAIPTTRDVGTGGCDVACATLASDFGAQLHYPDADKNFTVWDQKSRDVRSACRIEPATSKEVAAVLGVLVSNWCNFAVKSGGHSSSRDASNSVGGVTVDLKRISSVELSADRTQTRVGTGAIWGDVYRALEPKNLTVIGGRVDDVGVGGLLTGGGISFLSAQYGWATDNILEYELVLPNATIITANENCNSDLYFALRGGGNNFGIVTHFTLKTVSQGKIRGGQKFYSMDKMDALIDQSHKLTLSDDPSIGFWTGVIWMCSHNTTLALAQEMYSKPVQNPAVWSDFDKVEPLGSTMRTEYMSNFSMELKTGTPSGNRNWMATMTFLPSKEQEKRMVQIFNEEVDRVKAKAPTFQPSMTFQPIPMSAIKAMKVRGGSALGFESDTPLTLCNWASSWHDAKEDDAAYEFRQRMLARSRASAVELGVLHKYVYMNYADSERDDVFAGYNGRNVARMREIQKAIDPQGVFTREGLCRGYFKLF